jgi:5-methylthioadenosine/S-adenosylhomocysteine deaminase
MDARGEKTHFTLVIEKNKIQEIFPSSIKNKKYKNATLIDGSDFLITPGLWNGHNHSALSYLRSQGHGHKHMIEDLFFKTEPHLTEKLVEALALPDLITGLKSGTVGFVDHYYFHRGTARAIDSLGLRGFVSDTFLDNFGPFKGKKFFHDFKASIKKWNFSERVKPCVGPHATNTTSKSFFKELNDFARAENLKTHFHLSQTRSEFDTALKEHGKTPIQLADSIGALNENALAVHVIHAEGDDFKILQNSGVSIGFCPTSQIIFEKLAPIDLFLKHKIPLVVGTDDAASNDLADMHQEIKIAALLARDRGADTKNLAKKFFEASTRSVPRFFGIPSGLIEPGYFADLLFYPLTMESQPRQNIFESYVFSMNAGFLKASMIDGRFRLWNKEIIDLPQQDLEEKYQKALTVISKKTGIAL